jgi:carbonic anhydrase
MPETFKVPFCYKDVLSCEAVALSCVDFRFRAETLLFIKKFLAIESFDIMKFPGSARAINEKSENDFVLNSIQLPLDLHCASKIVIVNHQDCGAYGGSGAFQNPQEEQEFHEAELRRAGARVREKFQGIEVLMSYARLVDNNENVEFLLVK